MLNDLVLVVVLSSTLLNFAVKLSHFIAIFACDAGLGDSSHKIIAERNFIRPIVYLAIANPGYNPTRTKPRPRCDKNSPDK